MISTELRDEMDYIFINRTTSKINIYMDIYRAF